MRDAGNSSASSAKNLPSGRPLHDYANLYFHARNPMMYKRKENHKKLCVLGISDNVLDLPNVIIADCNAASDIVLFKPAPDGLEIIDKDLVYAKSWMHSNQIQTDQHKLIKCAEVLVPDMIGPEYILKAYVSCDQSHDALIPMINIILTELQVVVNSYLFFR